MRILICDDDKIFVSALRQNITECFEKLEIAEYEIVEYYLGEDLLNDKGDKDIVFLDIEMPGKNGIYVGNKLKETYPKAIVIIVTSFSEYLDDAMKFSVFRYFNKPIDKDRLFRNLKDAIEVYTRINLNVMICVDGEYKKINSEDIIMIEVAGRKLKMITEEETYILNGTIQEWSDKLNIPSFCVCHRGYLVNIKYVTSITKDTVYLNNGRYKAYVSKRNYDEIKNRFMLFVEKNM